MCPGGPVSDWAIICPRVSKTPQARSCDSRTTVLKAVRISAACCSLATERSRFQRTSSVTGSRVVASLRGEGGVASLKGGELTGRTRNLWIHAGYVAGHGSGDELLSSEPLA